MQGWTTKKPTKTGYYWLLMRPSEQYPEIVKICMEYTFRRKVVPHVLAVAWKGPLSDIPETALWSHQLMPPPLSEKQT